MSISKVYGIRINALAQVAELLPIPGGAIIRTGALVERGLGLAKRSDLVLCSPLLWVALAATLAFLALAPDWPAAWVGVLAAFAMTLRLVAWLGARYGYGFALASAALRLVGLSLTALRLWVAFLALGDPVPAMTSDVTP